MHLKTKNPPLCSAETTAESLMQEQPELVVIYRITYHYNYVNTFILFSQIIRSKASG